MPSVYDNLELLPQDLQGWNGNSDVFGELILRVKPKIIIEIGTWKGQSAITMATFIKLNKMDSKIYCVDTWLGALEFIDDNSPERDLMKKNGYPQVYYQFLSNVVHNNVQDIIIPFPMTSEIASKYFKKKGIVADLIYIDGSHEEEDVYRNLCDYFFLIDEGVMFGDDLTWQNMEYTIQKFCKNFSRRYYTLENNFWVIEKTI